MAGWIRAGLMFGVMALAIGTIIALLRTLLLVPAFGETTGMALEFCIAALLLIGSGLWVMRWYGRWTTNSALYFGGLGAGVYLIASLPINLVTLGDDAATVMNSAGLTHGALFPLSLAIMALGPAVVTQRA
jgi:hypothetical protein